MTGDITVAEEWGVHGKHPEFGDFISAGLVSQAETRLVPWLTETLAEVRDLMGEDWADRWDAAVPMRFWIGGAIWGGPALLGVWRPSRDRVGRRFPLMLVMATDQPAPVINPDQTPFEQAEAALERLATDADALREILGRTAPAAGPEPSDLPDFWAANPGLNATDLLADLAATDHLRASAARSYWWTAPAAGRASAIAAWDRLPNAHALAWLIAGVAAEDANRSDPAPETEAANAWG